MSAAFEKVKADLARIQTILETYKADMAAMQAGEQPPLLPEPSIDQAAIDQLRPDERAWFNRELGKMEVKVAEVAMSLVEVLFDEPRMTEEGQQTLRRVYEGLKELRSDFSETIGKEH